MRRCPFYSGELNGVLQIVSAGLKDKAENGIFQFHFFGPADEMSILKGAECSWGAGAGRVRNYCK